MLQLQDAAHPALGYSFGMRSVAPGQNLFVLLAAMFLGACAANQESPAPSSAARSGGKAPFTLTETDAVMAQVAQCWNIPMGAPNDEAMIVELRVFLNSDGSLRRAEPVDKERLERDPFYRASAEAASRAVERCSPLKLPSKKYEAWKEMVLVFDPGEWTAR